MRDPLASIRDAVIIVVGILIVISVFMNGF
jgi:hypothetical protein